MDNITEQARKRAIEQLKAELGVDYAALNEQEKDMWGHWLGDAAWLIESQLRK